MDATGPHLACLFCTQNCYRTHGEGKPLGPTVPTFCKIMTQSVVAKDSDCSFLELPSAFVREYWHELCKTAILEGPSGQTWSVDVSGTECIMNFKNGWQAFSFDHNLNEGDIVIFKLTTKAYFVVQVFDKDGCEKDLCGVQNSAAFALQCGTSSSKQRKKRIHPQKNLLERTNKHLELEKVANTCGLVAGGKKLSLDSEIGHDNKGGLHSTSCVDVDRTENRKKLKRCPLKGSSGVNSVDSHCSDPDCDDMNLLQDLIMSCKNINAANHQEEVTGGSSMPLTTLKQVIDLDSYKRKTVSGRKHIHDLNQEGSKTWSVEKKNSCLRIVSDTMAAAKSHNSSNPTVIVKMKYSQVTSGFWLIWRGPILACIHLLTVKLFYYSSFLSSNLDASWKHILYKPSLRSTLEDDLLQVSGKELCKGMAAPGQHRCVFGKFCWMQMEGEMVMASWRLQCRMEAFFP